MLTRIEAAWWRWRRRLSRNEWAVRGLGLGVTPDAPHAHGLLLIQIDGLAREQLERAVSRGRMPFLRRLMKRGHQLHTFYPGMPSSTPAVQAELYYGVAGAVPAFSFLDKRAGGIGMMMHPDWAKRIEADLQTQATGLLTGGSSWSNIYTGGAAQAESHFCGASIGLGDMWRTGKLRTLITFAFLHFGAFARLVGLLLLEMAIGFWDAMRGVFQQGRSLKREILFLFARVFVCVGLREMVTLGARLDVTRGLPIVHVNLLGYDEQSHRRGPDSAFAHWTLKGIDRAIRELHRAARRSGRRDYEVWIFSDHGQVRTKALSGVIEGGLEGLVRKHWPDQDAVKAAGGDARSQRRPSPGHWIGGPRAGAREAMHRAEAELSVFEKQEFAVAALGPVGHVYFGREFGAAETRRLAAALVSDGVGGVLLRREDGRADWLHAGGEQVLPDLPEGLPCAEPLRSEIAKDLARLCHNPHAGNLVVLGWGTKGECWTFAQENGSHAGPTAAEAQGFALLPANVWLPEEALSFIRPAVLRAAALRSLGRSETGAVVAAPRRQPSASSMALRVVTYNVHSCHGGDGRVSPSRIARVLERLDGDVVALQELDCGRERSRGEDQLALIAEKLGMHAYFCPAVTSGNSKYGHGVLSREPIRLVRRAVLPRGGRTWAEPREALWVTVPWLGQEVQLVTTHLGLGAAEQASQVADLLAPEWLGGIGTDKPVILCGDMNFPPGSAAYRKLAALMHDVQAHAPGHSARRTFPARWPLRRIDHIFASKHFEVCGVKVLEDDLARIASDHLPLAADLKLVAQIGATMAPAADGGSRVETVAAVSPGV